MDQNKFDFIFKVIVVILLFLLMIFTPIVAESDAAYSTNGSVSSSQELTIVVLPALEHALISSSQVGINASTYSLGVRSNTAWAFEYTATNTGSLNQPICSETGADGQRNLDDSFQEIFIACKTRWSWADEIEQNQTFTYTILPRLRGE